MAILSPPKTSMLFFLAILEGVLTMPIRKFFQDLGKREIALVILTGLVVAWVRHGLQYHWKLWDSWRNFFTSWFVHAMAVFLLMVVALWAIIYTHKFFLGRDMEGNEREVSFYVVMTILVASIGIAVLSNWASVG
jgi:hypothetical protein